jgi:hypothetical protein
MAILPQVSGRNALWRHVWNVPVRSGTFQTCRHIGAGLLLMTVLSGCVALGWGRCENEPPPPGIPCQVVAYWEPKVRFASDPTHGGNLTPGLAGRVYLFGPEIGTPMTGDGALVVDLFDETDPAHPAVLLEEWRLDPVTLKRLLRPDILGWGYTVFLPWGTYKPEINRVHLKVRYEPAKGTPLYAHSAPMTLAKENNTTVGPVVSGTEPPRPSLPAQPPHQPAPAQPPPAQPPPAQPAK